MQSSEFGLRAVKQKLIADSVCYLLQEVYGIENKHGESGDNSMDCVICMCELRDTIILPCRHLCLCYSCAETLRYKLKNCPICRSAFRALLQLRTLRRIRGNLNSAPSLTQILNLSSKPTAKEEEGNSAAPTKSFLQTRYDSVSLVEALNGQMDHTKTVLTRLSIIPVIHPCCLALPTAPTKPTKATNPTPWPIVHSNRSKKSLYAASSLFFTSQTPRGEHRRRVGVNVDGDHRRCADCGDDGGHTAIRAVRDKCQCADRRDTAVILCTITCGGYETNESTLTNKL